MCVCVCSSTICFTCDVLQISTELLEARREELQRDRGRRGRWRSLSPNLVVTTICCRHPHPDTRSQSGKRRREEMSRGKLGKPVNLGRRGAKKATVIVVCAGRKSMAQKKLICFDLFLEYICTYCVYVCLCVYWETATWSSNRSVTLIPCRVGFALAFFFDVCPRPCKVFLLSPPLLYPSLSLFLSHYSYLALIHILLSHLTRLINGNLPLSMAAN